jgi:hypothetical protein
VPGKARAHSRLGRENPIQDRTEPSTAVPARQLVIEASFGAPTNGDKNGRSAERKQGAT